MFRLMLIVCLLSPYANSNEHVKIIDVIEEIKLCSPEVISSYSDLMTAKNEIEIEKKKRLPSFSLSASTESTANSNLKTNIENVATVNGRYTIYSFGKFDANESEKKQSYKVQEQKYKIDLNNTFKELLSKKIQVIQIEENSSINKRIIKMQKKLLDRVNRRKKMDYSSEVDENAIYSKYLLNVTNFQQDNKNKENLITEINKIACTQSLKNINVNNVLSQNLKNTQVEDNYKIQLLKQKMNLKKSEINVLNKSYLPNLELVGNKPLSTNNNSFSNNEAKIGLEVSVEYGNLGLVTDEEINKIEENIILLSLEIEKTQSNLYTELEQIDKQVMHIENKILPNQMKIINSINRKLESKERLFKAGKVSLFELLATYDELQNTVKTYNNTKSNLLEQKLKKYSILNFGI